MTAKTLAAATALVARARAAGDQGGGAESCTGGLVAGAITAVPGASQVFDRGFVTYSNAAKQDLLGVAAHSLITQGAVSETVAREMAEGALRASVATLAVAVTGIAGPGGSDHKPEGRVCFALAAEGRATRVETVDFGALGRAEVRAASVAHALALLAAALDQPAP